MKCAWDELIRILPPAIRNEVDTNVKASLQEVRLRNGYPIELVCHGKKYLIQKCATVEDMQFIINTASMYSPWKAQSSANGYITAAGGHRIGICGEAITYDGVMSGICNITSLCVRVARDFPGIANTFHLDNLSVLIIGPPGSGKTTLLRDMIRNYSMNMTGSISVVDERGEIFPSINGRFVFACGSNTDVLTNCNKAHGIETVLKSMSPACIAVDEITKEEDCRALLNAIGCGVSLIATAHAACVSDLTNRDIYKSLLLKNIFKRIIIMSRDKTWIEERI